MPPKPAQFGVGKLAGHMGDFVSDAKRANFAAAQKLYRVARGFASKIDQFSLLRKMVNFRRFKPQLLVEIKI